MRGELGRSFLYSFRFCGGVLLTAGRLATPPTTVTRLGRSFGTLHALLDIAVFCHVNRRPLRGEPFPLLRHFSCLFFL